jgi:ABC-type polysaccharide/polyol phosphate export permease
VQVVTQFGFWLTPVFWKMNNFSPEAQFYLKLNPMTYIVEGFRDSLFMNGWFWQKPEQTIYFWGFTLFALVLGNVVFKRLQPHFSEVI